MSFGRPASNLQTLSVSPPERGSFPLDHDGECKSFMQDYLKCLKQNKNNVTECRFLSKQYLGCRMDKGLMEKDDWENLGLQDAQPNSTASNEKSPS